MSSPQKSPTKKREELQRRLARIKNTDAETLVEESKKRSVPPLSKKAKAKPSPRRKPPASLPPLDSSPTQHVDPVRRAPSPAKEPPAWSTFYSSPSRMIATERLHMRSFLDNSDPIMGLAELQRIKLATLLRAVKEQLHDRKASGCKLNVDERRLLSECAGDLTCVELGAPLAAASSPTHRGASPRLAPLDTGRRVDKYKRQGTQTDWTGAQSGADAQRGEQSAVKKTDQKAAAEHKPKDTSSDVCPEKELGKETESKATEEKAEVSVEDSVQRADPAAKRVYRLYGQPLVVSAAQLLSIRKGTQNHRLHDCATLFVRRLSPPDAAAVVEEATRYVTVLLLQILDGIKRTEAEQGNDLAKPRPHRQSTSSSRRSSSAEERQFVSSVVLRALDRAIEVLRSNEGTPTSSQSNVLEDNQARPADEKQLRPPVQSDLTRQEEQATTITAFVEQLFVRTVEQLDKNEEPNAAAEEAADRLETAKAMVATAFKSALEIMELSPPADSEEEATPPLPFLKQDTIEDVLRVFTEHVFQLAEERQ